MDPYTPGMLPPDPKTGAVAMPQTTAAPATDPTPAEAAAQGLGWVDKNHPLYGTPGYVGSKSGGSGAAAPPSGVAAAPPPASTTTNSTPAQNIATQGTNAQTYSQTPGAAPTTHTTNQGTQDVVRNSYLERALQPANVDPRTNTAIRTQSDAFAAAAERARRDQGADLAEAVAGTGQVGAQTAEQRLINERAATARGSFEAELVGQELKAKRDEITGALEALKGWITEDQKMALTQKLADIDAQLKTAALNASTSLGHAELSLKDKLGMAGINVDLMSLLQNDSQFNKTLGFNIGDREAYYNQSALNSLFGS